MSCMFSDSWLIWVVGAYVCGATSFALLLGKLRGVDVRQVGSGNVGATNAGRVLGRKWGVICFLLDVLKGLVPVLAGGITLGYVRSAESSPILTNVEQCKWLTICAAAVMGHVFSFWLRFKGGKGVATSFGALLGVWPILTLPSVIALLVWGLVVKVSRYIGLASVIAAVSLPLAAAIGSWINHDDPLKFGPMILVSSLLALLVVWRHRGNLARIAAGTEPKLGQSKTPESASS
jgi:acyl phosphate:glycerol-3-phosphate acyltransferase